MPAADPRLPILVINPNSDLVVTEAIRTALRPFAAAHPFEVIHVPHGPATIRSDEDAARAGLDLLEIARARRAEGRAPGAILSGCFSDPGVDLLRADGFRAFGLQEAALLTACAMADRFGIIALSARAVPRHLRRIGALGLSGRLAAELPLSDVSARDAGVSDAVFAEALEVGAALRERGAGAVALGCAGFSPRRGALEAALGIPVIDPVAAAAGMALSVVLQGG